MSLTNVAFYQKMKDLQDRQHKTEKQRLELEQQFHTYAKSDHRLARLKAIRLQNYWKKICEDEKRSQQRNEQLLKEFEQVESHMAKLRAQTEKLRLMKKQYEETIEKTYPNWKERILHYIQMQKQMESLAQAGADVRAQQSATGAGFTPSSTAVYAVPTSLTTMSGTDSRYTVAQQPVTSQTPTSTGQVGTMPTSAGYINLADQPTAYRISHTLPPHTMGSLHHGLTEVTKTSLSLHDLSRQQHESLEGCNAEQSATQGQLAQSNTYKEHDADDEQSSIEEMKVSDKGHMYGSPEAGQQQQQQSAKETASHWRTEDTDDFDSEMSSPLSGNNDKMKSDYQTTNQQEQSRLQEMQNDSILLRPEITLEGVYNLLSAIEQELPTAKLSEIYRTDMPAESVKKEIMENANKGSMLSHMNCASISMVIIDQLPLLVASCEDNCLLPDKILVTPSPAATQDSVRFAVHPTAQPFWDRLCEHFIQLLKYSVMDADEIAEMFAPLLISSESPYSNGATTLLKTVLNNTEIEMVSPTSTSTFSTLSPRKQNDPNFERAKSDKPLAPPVDLKCEQDASEEDDFFSQPVPKDEPVVPLTQTAAYRQLLGGTMSATQNTVSYIDSDEDEVEAKLTSALSSKKDDTKRECLTVDLTSNKYQATVEASSESSRSPSPESTAGDKEPDTEHKSYVASLGSTGKSSKAAIAMRGDSDTDEDVAIPGVTSEVKSISKGTEDDFDFYG